LRQQLITLENIRTEIQALIIINNADKMLKVRLNEYLLAAIADLFILYDFLIEVESCIDENDLELLLELSEETETVN
jgi:hypothetical protein